jgi:hypothetical protein
MSWAPNDLVVDADLVAYESTILTQFAVPDWQARRQKAIEDWLFPLLEGRGFAPHRWRTRFVPSAVLGYTSASFTDLTTAAQDTEGLTLSSVLTGTSDALYVGSDQPFRGVSIRMIDHVNAVALTLTKAMWQDAWSSVTGVSDGTRASAGVPLSQGGAITWTTPDGLTRRTVNTTGPLYWLKLSVSSAPTAGTKAGALLVIRRSRLCAAVTFRTLALIFREAPTAQDGPWREKAEWYEAQAEQAWLRVADLIGGEFDADDSDAIDTTEAGQTADSVTGGGFTLERA